MHACLTLVLLANTTVKVASAKGKQSVYCNVGVRDDEPRAQHTAACSHPGSLCSHCTATLPLVSKGS